MRLRVSVKFSSERSPSKELSDDMREIPRPEPPSEEKRGRCIVLTVLAVLAVLAKLTGTRLHFSSSSAPHQFQIDQA